MEISRDYNYLACCSACHYYNDFKIRASGAEFQKLIRKLLNKEELLPCKSCKKETQQEILSFGI